MAMTTNPPIAARKPTSFTTHNRTISDDYAWLRDPAYPEVTDPDILAYLHAENAWFEAWMAPQQELVETLFQEMKGRIKEDDKSVPVKDGDFLYWREFAMGAQYRTWWRRALSEDGGAGGEAECILDEPVLAEGHDYFRVGSMSVSPCAKFLAYSLDTDGSERFTLFVRDLTTGELLPDTIPGTLSALVWTSDSKGLLYGLANDQWRTDNARLHWLGSDPASDVELFHEADEGFRVDVGMTHSEKFLVIATGDNETSEVRLLPADNPLAEPLLVAARRKGVEYGVEERESALYIHTNDSHPNFRLATASVDAPGEWTTLIAASDHFYMTDVSVFANFYVVEGREDGLDQVEVRYYEDPARVERIAFPEASYDAGLGETPEFKTDTLRIGYESMVTPATTYDYDVASRALTVRKVQEIPSGYDAALYDTARLMLPARDGVMVPVSLVWRRDLVDAGRTPAPLYLYAYGAYGYAVPPGFSTTRMSLTDRGFVYAIAHIRGGDDLGRHWWLDGKLTKRTNTFNDFVDVARGLIDAGWTEAGQIAIAGGSAGGELVGAVLNQAPELWGAAAAHVPFVDVLNTMMDATLPLTPGEWPEWGNPIEDAAAFDLLASYSPYDNVTAQAYPPLLVTAGLNDPRVTYWEPAKWVAKLRATKTDANPLLLKTNMGAGHGGKSGRFESLREDAEEYAFMLGVLGVG
jgi:oligopeptidase B